MAAMTAITRDYGDHPISRSPDLKKDPPGSPAG